MTAIHDHVPDDFHAPTVAPAWTQNELLDAPESGYARVHLALVAAELRGTVFQHCRPAPRLRPLRGIAWGIEWFHADDCPGGGVL